jgi:peptidoglycan hydrolase CwlO-like protein
MRLILCGILPRLLLDLSSEIRGERIRFVEAMSQATSMNIQREFIQVSSTDPHLTNSDAPIVHVEEFKKQLTHEVIALNDEVARLRDERKTIQHQIAQLFMMKSEHEAELGASEASAFILVNGLSFT